jgi:putative flippase GtrA
MSGSRLASLPLTHRFGRYFVVGGVTAVTDWGLFSGLYFLGLHYLAAGTISFVLVVMLNYFLSIRFVFQRGYHSRSREIMLMYLVSGVGLVIHLAALAALIEYAGLHPVIAKIGASATGLAWNFTARHLWIFPAA